MQNENEIFEADRIEQMVAANKWIGLRDSLDGAIELQDALFMRPNAESFFSLVKAHKHGKIFRLSLYLSIYRDGVGEPLASIAMTEDDLSTLRRYLADQCNDNGKCFNCGQSLACENCGR